MAINYILFRTMLPRLDYDDTANVIYVSNSLPLEIILRLYVIWRAVCRVIIVSTCEHMP